MSRSLAAAILFSSFSQTGLAQEAAEESIPNTAQTNAETNTSGAPGTEPAPEETEADLPLITIYGTRQASDPLDLPGNISVLGRGEMQSHFVSDMQDLTRYEPGITADRTTSGTDPFGTFSGFTIRGVGGNRVQVLVDGSRIPERIVDGTRDYLDFNFVRQADIVRGPGSVLWGSDALGGIVALRTVDPEDILIGDKTRGGEFTSSYDTLDKAFNNSLTYAQRLTPQLSILGGVAHTRANEPEFGNARADGGSWGCPRNIEYGATACNALNPMEKSSWRGLGKIVFTPNADHRFMVSADYLRRDTDVQFDSVLGPSASGFTTSSERHLKLHRGRYGIEHEWDVGNTFIDDIRWSFAYSPSGYERTGVGRTIDTDGDSIVTDDFLSYDENFTELDIQLTSRFATGPVDHTITWGFDGDYTKTDYERLSIERNLTTGTISEARAGGFNFANATTTRADFFVQNEIAAFDHRLKITPGLRFAYYSLDPRPDADYQAVPGEEPAKVSKSTLLLNIGAMYDLTDNFSVYGTYSQGFKMPTAQQLYTSLPGTSFDLVPAPDLKPESVDNYEIGVRGYFDQGYFSLGGFYADYADFIENFYNPPGTNNYTYRNLNSVTVYGIEAKGAYDITSALRTDFSLAWQKGRQKADGSESSTPHNVPPLTAIVGLNYMLPQYDTSLEAVGTFVAPVKETASVDNYKPDGYALLDLFANWQPTSNTELRLGVKNVFDQRYFLANAATYGQTATEAVARTNPIELQTGAARTFMASFTVNF